MGKLGLVSGQLNVGAPKMPEIKKSNGWSEQVKMGVSKKPDEI